MESPLRRIHVVKIFDDSEHIREFMNMEDYLRRWEPVTKQEVEMIFHQENGLGKRQVKNGI